MNVEQVKEFAKKHWIWLAAAGALLAFFLISRTRTSQVSGQQGLSPSQQAALAQGNTQAQVANNQLAAQYAAAALGADTQVKLAQIQANGQAITTSAALQADLARTQASLAAVQGQQGVQNNSTAAAASAYNQQGILNFAGTLAKNLPTIVRGFGGGSGGGSSVIPSDNAPGGSFTPGPADFSGPSTASFITAAPDPYATAAATGGFGSF